MVMFNSAQLLVRRIAAGAGALAYRHSTPCGSGVCPRPARVIGARTRFPRVGAWVGAACGSLALLGCAGGEPPATGLSGGAGGIEYVPRRSAWRDVDSAVRAALAEAGLAILHAEQPAPGVKRYSLVSILDEEGELVATAPPGALQDPDAMRVEVVRVREAALTCRIGRDGDAAREKRFMDAIRAWKAKKAR